MGRINSKYNYIKRMLRVINMIENEQEQKIFNLSLFAITRILFY